MMTSMQFNGTLITVARILLICLVWLTTSPSGWAQSDVLLAEDFRTTRPCVVGKNMERYTVAKEVYKVSNGVFEGARMLSGLYPEYETMPLHCDSCVWNKHGKLVQKASVPSVDFSAYVMFFLSTPDVQNWSPQIWAITLDNIPTEAVRCSIEFDVAYLSSFGNVPDSVPLKLAFGGTNAVFSDLDNLDEHYRESCGTLLDCMPFDLTTEVMIPSKEGWVHVQREVLLPKGVRHLFFGELQKEFTQSATVDGVAFMIDNIRIIALER